MRLTVSTPTALIEDVENLRHLRAEDESGAFGILPGHADFVTVLPVSIVTWRKEDGREGFVLVRRGVMTVRDGNLVEIAARGGYRDEELQALGATVIEELRKEDTTEEILRTSDTRLHLATMRQVEKVLRSTRGAKAGPSPLSASSDSKMPESDR